MVADYYSKCLSCGQETHWGDTLPPASPACQFCGGTLVHCSSRDAQDELTRLVNLWYWGDTCLRTWIRDWAARDPGGCEVQCTPGDEVCRRSNEHIPGGMYCGQLEPPVPCRPPRRPDLLRDLRVAVARLASDRGCVTCPSRIAVPPLTKGWLAERLAATAWRGRARQAEDRAAAAAARVAMLEAELDRLRTGGGDPRGGEDP